MLILSGAEWINLRIVATWVKILNCSNGKRLKGFFGYGNEIYFRILKGIAKGIKNLCVDRFAFASACSSASGLTFIF